MLSENQGLVPRKVVTFNPRLSQETITVQLLVRDPVTITQNDSQNNPQETEYNTKGLVLPLQKNSSQQTNISTSFIYVTDVSL